MLWNLWRENWFYFREFSRLFGYKITYLNSIMFFSYLLYKM